MQNLLMILACSIFLYSACGDSSGVSNKSLKNSATPYPMDADLKKVFPETVELPKEITIKLSASRFPGNAKMTAKKFSFRDATIGDPYRDLILQDMFPLLVDRSGKVTAGDMIAKGMYCAQGGQVSEKKCAGNDPCEFDGCFAVWIGRYPTATQAEEAKRHKEQATPDWVKNDLTANVDWARGNLMVVSPNGFVF